jgi:AAA domain
MFSIICGIESTGFCGDSILKLLTSLKYRISVPSKQSKTTVLVDGDKQGAEYTKELLKCKPKPGCIVQWPLGWAIEEVVAWILQGDEASTLAKLNQYLRPAGTGKTHSLIAELTSLLKRRPLRDGQRVFGMTYMHGARRRLHARLQEVQGLRGKFLCTTFDSFARRLLHRWRTLVCELNPQVDGLAVTDFETVCEHAAGLLCNQTVREWVAQAYPIVLVDELQDIRQSRLRSIRELAKSVFLIAAADEFQDLFNTGANEAVAWARSACKPVQLTNCYRTAQAGLLSLTT